MEIEPGGGQVQDGQVDVEAVVIGAGFSGLFMLQRLRQLGISVQVIEAGDDVGGTWYWNRYPGARCDSESVYYCFSDAFSEEIARTWTWSERYAGQPEILRYFQHVADELDLRCDIRFGTRVTGARFDEDTDTWEVTTDRGDRIRSRFLVTAVGALSAANMPDIPGLDAFEGDWYHTGSWPHEGVDLAGKRVGVVGTGATGIQVVPAIAEEAEHVWVFQRTANYGVAGRNRQLEPEYMAQIQADYPTIWADMRASGFGLPFTPEPLAAVECPEDERQAKYEAAWQHGGLAIGFTFDDLMTNQASNDTLSDFLRGKIRASVQDPELADLLVPDHGFATRRPPLEHGYFEAFNRGDVTLVDLRRSPIDAITPTGVRTADDTYDLDVLVFATGFDAFVGSLVAMDIRGRDDVALADVWAEGPKTYLGVATVGFPNLFLMLGPQSPSVLTNVVVSSEQHAEWIGDCIAHLRGQGLTRIEASPDAQDDWIAHVAETAERSLARTNKDSWWFGANVPGKPRLLYGYMGGVGHYREHCATIAAKGYEGFELG